MCSAFGGCYGYPECAISCLLSLKDNQTVKVLRFWLPIQTQKLRQHNSFECPARWGGFDRASINVNQIREFIPVLLGLFKRDGLVSSSLLLKETFMTATSSGKAREKWSDQGIQKKSEKMLSIKKSVKTEALHDYATHYQDNFSYSRKLWSGKNEKLVRES